MEAVNYYKIAFCGAYFGTITAFFLSWLIREVKRQIRNRNFLKSMDKEIMDEEIKIPSNFLDNPLVRNYQDEELQQISNTLINCCMTDLKLNIQDIYGMSNGIDRRSIMLKNIESSLYYLGIISEQLTYDEKLFFYINKLNYRLKLLTTKTLFQSDFFKELLHDCNELENYLDRRKIIKPLNN